MRVLVACEESQRVANAFRARGHEAYSCDLQMCSGGHPEYHLQCDALEMLKIEWDLLIAHPPCTYLSASGAVHLYNKNHEIRDGDRDCKGFAAANFFNMFLNSKIKKVCVENPVPLK